MLQKQAGEFSDRLGRFWRRDHLWRRVHIWRIDRIRRKDHLCEYGGRWEKLRDKVASLDNLVNSLEKKMNAKNLTIKQQLARERVNPQP